MAIKSGRVVLSIALSPKVFSRLSTKPNKSKQVETALLFWWAQTQKNRDEISELMELDKIMKDKSKEISVAMETIKNMQATRDVLAAKVEQDIKARVDKEVDKEIQEVLKK